MTETDEIETGKIETGKIETGATGAAPPTVEELEAKLRRHKRNMRKAWPRGFWPASLPC